MQLSRNPEEEEDGALVLVNTHRHTELQRALIIFRDRGESKV